MIAETDHIWPAANSPYGLLMLASLVWGLWRWHRRTRGEPELMLVLIGALAGGFLGAKLAYLLAEGAGDWTQPDRWLRLLTGKSVLGGLLGAYAGAEMMKRHHGIRRHTSDGFAATLPFGLLLGRIGCILHGCCLGRRLDDASFAVCDAHGVSRWPAPQVEAAFQLLMLGVLVTLRHRGILKDRLFFLYLVAYGAFRFVHEFLRATPKAFGPIGVYHIIALVMVATGAIAWHRRNQESSTQMDSR